MVTLRVRRQTLIKKDSKTVTMYDLKYEDVVGDRDSNVYKTILDSMAYDKLQVEKLDCQIPEQFPYSKHLKIERWFTL
ncbi:hypothetical protein NPIL_610171 [Nephila pilipes]|uniref:Mutator-like transposase domain-containing protein n=1 Tax=Nephila pilipes TaxID=299642 RepID=A0A8X6NF99_NEPPI|nr:hypothetical protein NPIL_307311 [Nephila pilipes]GFT10299.1 hypothetical protein NPIL_610171 [Nephila pilipes]